MTRECAACGQPFEAKRSTARYCGEVCKKRAQRRQPKGAKSAPPAPRTLVDVTRARLEAVGRLDTVIGQQALRLAGRLLSDYDTGSALAALSREFRATMTEALADVEVAADPLDELAKRRRAKASGG